MSNTVTIVGAGLAGSEAALNLASRGISVRLVEMRPAHPTAVHHTGDAAELVCSNSLKSTKPDSAAGLLKAELTTLESPLIAAAKRHAVAAGGALAVDRVLFSRDVTRQVEEHPSLRWSAARRRTSPPLPPARTRSSWRAARSPPTRSRRRLWP
ncbi:MAG: FAD-dependent oxidoreductase [Adlercreutzia equolifaciens]